MFDLLCSWTPGPLELIVIAGLGFLVFVLPILIFIFLVFIIAREKKRYSDLEGELRFLREEVEKLKQVDISQD
jgi:hypothetical protein